MAIASIVYPRCHKILPLTYSNSLSYYEEVCSLVNKVNELIEEFNSYEEIINQLSELSVEIDGMLTDITTLKSQMVNVNSTLSSLGNSISSLTDTDTYLQSQITQLTNKVNSIITDYNNLYDNIVSYVDNKVASIELDNQTEWLQFKVDINTIVSGISQRVNELELLLEDVPTKVYNPVRGRDVGFNQNNADIYQDLRYGSFTNAELSEFGISNDEVASRCLNNRDYALHAKKRFKRHYVFSPVTGVEVSHANALSQILVSAIGRMTNTDFYSYLEANNMTNDNLTDVLSNNFNRYTVELSLG